MLRTFKPVVALLALALFSMTTAQAASRLVSPLSVSSNIPVFDNPSDGYASDILWDSPFSDDFSRYDVKTLQADIKNTEQPRFQEDILMDRNNAERAKFEKHDNLPMMERAPDQESFRYEPQDDSEVHPLQPGQSTPTF